MKLQQQTNVCRDILLRTQIDTPPLISESRVQISKEWSHTPVETQLYLPEERRPVGKRARKGH